jgi:hypothetical protein
LTLDGNWGSTYPDQIFGTSESRRCNRGQKFFFPLASQHKSERKNQIAVLPNLLAIGCSTNPDSNQITSKDESIKLAIDGTVISANHTALLVDSLANCM